MAFSTNVELEKRMEVYVILADYRKWPEFKTVLAKTISCNMVQIYFLSKPNRDLHVLQHELVWVYGKHIQILFREC